MRHVSAFAPAQGSPNKFYDIDSGKEFVESWAVHHQGTGKSSTNRVREITNEIKKIFHYEDLEILADQSRHELLVAADGQSQRLGELGTGLAQFILLLGNIAFANPSYVLIDEPETNLHPSLQLLFMQSIAAKSNLGVIFATHSLGLARQAADRIFALTRNAEDCEMSELKDTPNLAQLVGELSFGRADSLGSRRLLLVEGPNDIMTFETLLATFNRAHEFAILSLGGRGGISPSRERELEHIIAINPNVVAIIDSDKKSPTDSLGVRQVEFREICARLGIGCHVLERRAIENYLPERALRAALPKAPFRELKPYERMEDVHPSWDKKDDWRIARQMSKTEIESSDLGRILASL